MLLLLLAGAHVASSIRAYAATSYQATVDVAGAQSVIVSSAFSIAATTGAAGGQSAVTDAAGETSSIVDADNSGV